MKMTDDSTEPRLMETPTKGPLEQPMIGVTVTAYMSPELMATGNPGYEHYDEDGNFAGWVRSFDPGETRERLWVKGRNREQIFKNATKMRPHASRFEIEEGDWNAAKGAAVLQYGTGKWLGPKLRSRQATAESSPPPTSETNTKSKSPSLPLMRSRATPGGVKGWLRRFEKAISSLFAIS
jgi:hypothetical protein